MTKDKVERAEHEDEPDPTQPPADDRKKDALEGKKPAPYVFRFAPANPKNSLDFEDMADK